MRIRSSYKRAFAIVAGLVVTPPAHSHGYAPDSSDLLRKAVPPSCFDYFFGEIPGLRRLAIVPTADGKGIAVDMLIQQGKIAAHRVINYRPFKIDNGVFKSNGIYVNGYQQVGTGKNNTGINLTVSGGSFYATDDNAAILSYEDQGKTRIFKIESLPGSSPERMQAAEQQRQRYRNLAKACF